MTSRRALGMAMSPTGQDLPVVYHATLAGFLPAIYEIGLVPGGSGRGVGKGAYAAWSGGKIFLSGPQDAFFWFRRVEEHGEYGSDDIRHDGAIPVMLRVQNLRRLLNDDTVAASEMKSDSYYVRRPIPSRQIQVFNGRKWAGVDMFSDDEEVEEFVRAHTVCEHDGDGGDGDKGDEDDGYDENGEEECDFVSLRQVVHNGHEMNSTFPPELYPGAVGGARGSRGRVR